MVEKAKNGRQANEEKRSSPRLKRRGGAAHDQKPSPRGGKGDREVRAVDEVVEILDITKLFEFNSGNHLIRQLALKGSLTPSPP